MPENHELVPFKMSKTVINHLLKSNKYVPVVHNIEPEEEEEFYEPDLAFSDEENE